MGYIFSVCSVGSCKGRRLTIRKHTMNWQCGGLVELLQCPCRSTQQKQARVNCPGNNFPPFSLGLIYATCLLYTIPKTSKLCGCVVYLKFLEAELNRLSLEKLTFLFTVTKTLRQWFFFLHRPRRLNKVSRHNATFTGTSFRVSWLPASLPGIIYNTAIKLKHMEWENLPLQTSTNVTETTLCQSCFYIVEGHLLVTPNSSFQPLSFLRISWYWSNMRHFWIMVSSPTLLSNEGNLSNVPMLSAD